MKRLSWLFVAAAVGLAAAPAQTSRDADLGRAFAPLDRFVERRIRADRAPGLALAVTSRDRLLYVKTYGLRDVAARLPVTPETLFEIGSISKSFTAIALLQLREEGKFDPRAPIVKYLPWLSVQSRFAPITGHHLLSHTSGLPRDRDDIPSSPYQAYGVRERTTGSEPGAKWAYSNVGFQILGYALEEIAGKPYPHVIRERILAPLGMHATEAAITHELRPRLAVGYEGLYDDRPWHPSHPVVPATWLEYAAGDGSLSSTPADLAAYLRMLLNRGAGPDGRRVLSPESFDLLIQRVAKQGDGYYGYGMGASDKDGHVIIAHSGGMVGYSSMLMGDLDDGIGAVALVNGPGRAGGPVVEFAIKVARAAVTNRAPPALPPAEAPAEVPDAAEYAGVYMAPDGRPLRLVANDRSLTLEHKGQRIALERRGRDRFLANHPDFALFLLRFGREGGRVVEVTHGPAWYVTDRYTGPRTFTSPPEWAAFPGHYRTAHPWFSNFRIVLRGGKLWLVGPDGGEEEVAPAEDGLFRVGEELSAERIRFDAIVEGKALRANLSGVDYYRVFTP